jgi:hypothetical protein
MKLRLPLLSLLALLPAALFATPITLTPPEDSRLAGRIHFTREPGGGTGSMKLVDLRFPQKEMRVGPTERSGTGLGLLLGFRVTDEARAALEAGARAELVVHVRSSAMGGSPSPLKVALLDSAAPDNDDSFSWFGAWNNGNAFTALGEIDADPDIGPHSFDATAALAAARRTSASRPVVFFAVYGPFDDLVDLNKGRHVIFEASGDKLPRLVITPRR